MLAQVCMCFASLGCLISGIVLIELATEHSHEHMVHDYVQAVDMWSLKRHEFGKLHITVTTDIGNESVTLLAHRAPDSLHNADDGADLPSYERLTYRASVPMGFLPTVALADVHAVSRKERYGMSVVFTLVVNNASLTTEAVPLVRALGHHEAGGEFDHCSRQKGLKVAGMCWIYSRIEQLCVQVAFNDSTQSWQLTPRATDYNMSYGCDYAGGKFMAPAYKIIHASEAMEGGHVKFDDFILEVYSYFDPYLRALELTHGKLTFGMTAEEEDLLGFVLIFMGIAFSVPPMCAFCRMWYKRRSKPASRYTPPHWKRRGPDPELVGMKYAVDSHTDSVAMKYAVDSDSVKS